MRAHDLPHALDVTLLSPRRLADPLARVHDVASRFVHDFATHQEQGLFVSLFLELATALLELRGASSHDEWQAHIRALRELPLLHLLRQDIITDRALCRPRGYPGDALTLDYAYGVVDIAELRHVTPLGKAIGSFIVQSGPVQAIRTRRQILADHIDDCFARLDRPAILSVACGHLRELALCRRYQAARATRVHALDHDALSLEVVCAVHPELRANLVRRNALRLLGEPLPLPPMDLVYSAGLYDYLDQEICRALTARLFRYLRPGGRLLLPNFMPSNAMRGYMEVFMDWPLVHRSLEELHDVTAGIPADEIGSCRVYSDGHGVIGYVELTRAA